MALVIWLLEYEHELYFDSQTTTSLAAFSDINLAIEYADAEYEYFVHGKRDFPWYWDDVDQYFRRAVYIGPGESSSLTIRMLEVDPTE